MFLVNRDFVLVGCANVIHMFWGKMAKTLRMLPGDSKSTTNSLKLILGTFQKHPKTSKNAQPWHLQFQDVPELAACPAPIQGVATLPMLRAEAWNVGTPVQEQIGAWTKQDMAISLLKKCGSFLQRISFRSIQNQFLWTIEVWGPNTFTWPVGCCYLGIKRRFHPGNIPSRLAGENPRIH